ncbi:MAG: hypothetical protein WB615_03055 [Candidatus Tumulicola sp.]
MATDAKAIGSLLYISDQTAREVFVFSYPYYKVKGELTGFTLPLGECVDKAGNVFVTDGTGDRILKYAHGGMSPVATLKDPGDDASGCAVDPTSGNLAVANLYSHGNQLGNVAIYKDAEGGPIARYADVNISEMYFCGYDNAGNLFIAGTGSGGGFRFGELARGARSIKDISLDTNIVAPGGVQWDGYHVAVGDEYTGVVYRFQINGTNGKELNKTTLAPSVTGFWIQRPNIIGPNFTRSNVGIWGYPAGGTAKKILSGKFQNPIGAVVSSIP